MRKLFFVLFVLGNMISCSILVLGQDASVQKNLNLIIKASGDTIKSPTIKTKFFDSNESQVTYLRDKTVLILNATDVTFYFDGSDKFNSMIIKDEGGKKLIKYIVTGPLYIGQSFDRNGKSTLYLKLKEENAFINLETKMSDVESFLKEYLNDFEQFKIKYKKKIYYELESLSEFASAYNAYKEPETYVAIKFEKPQTLKVGLYVSYNINSLKYNNDVNSYASPSMSLGLNFINQYSRNVSFDVLSNLNISSFKFDNNVNPKLVTISLEPTLGVGLFVNDDLCVKFNAGIAAFYNIGSEIKFENSSVRIKGLNVGYTLGAGLVLKSKYSLSLSYLNYKFTTKDNIPGSIDPVRVQGALSSVRLGLCINF